MIYLIMVVLDVWPIYSKVDLPRLNPHSLNTL